jgi:CRISPR-associated protein Csd1
MTGILQALALYNERLFAEEAVQPPGFQEKQIPWVIELGTQGELIALRRTGGEDGRGRKFAVPAEVEKSVNIAANLLWGNAEYVLGQPRPGLTGKQAAKVPKRHEAFLARLRALPEATRADPGVAAVIAFLERDDFAALQSEEGWADLARGGANVSFRLDGDDGLVCERPAVRAAVSKAAEEPGGDTPEAWCLITGRRARPTRLHPSITGVSGAQSRGAKLVSFNEDAYTSHGWSRGANAPVSAAATHAYATALKHLLDRDNDRQRFVEGDTTFVFWAAAKRPIEDQFSHLLGSYGTGEQESDGTPVRETFDSVRRGLRPSLDDPTPFYVLGLAPNTTRLAVRIWHEGTVADLARNILRHFDDLTIIGFSGDIRVPGLWRLISAAAREGDLKKLSDTLRGQLAAGVMAAVLDGLPYPSTLLTRTVARCQTECSKRDPQRDPFRLMLPIRAALIKACLKRRYPTQEVTVSLDPDEPDVGYRLGRLFAVLENVQRESTRSDAQQRGRSDGDGSSQRNQLNVTIRDRYFGAFMTAPRSVFPQLMHLKNAHLKKVRRITPKLAGYFEHQIDLVLDPLRPKEGLPSTLSLEEQGRFILGYHHQRNSWRSGNAEDKKAEGGDFAEPETTE